MRLGDFIKVNPESIRREYPFTAIEYIDISSVGMGTLQGTQHLQLADAPSRAKRIVRDGDTLLATVRPNLRAFWFAQRTAPNTIASTGFAVLRAGKSMHERFLYYTVTNQPFTDYLTANAKGAAYPAVDTDTIERVEVDIPSLPTQHKIAAILSAYDDLIENNLRRIKILEEMAQMLYREWFVNFRFPGHEKVKMVDSPLGNIPEGWTFCKLGDLISVDRGLSYKGFGLTSNGNPMVNLKNILPNGGFRRDATKPYSGEYKKRHVVYAGDIILANTDLTQAGNVVGSPAIIPDIDGGKDIIISHHIYAVRIEDETIFPRYFVYHLLLSPAFKGYAKGYALGTTVLGLAKEGILEYTLAKPPSELLQNFQNSVHSIYAAIENYHQRNNNLRRTRDLLLPKLISGEVDVSELDITIPEEVA